MKYTDKYNLKKPEPFENVLVEDLNENMDIVDTELSKIGNSQTEVMQQFTEHKADDASLTKKGHVQLNSSTSSNDETTAATPKAVKIVHDALIKQSEEMNRTKPDSYYHTIPITGTYVGTMEDNVYTVSYKNTTTFVLRKYSLKTKELRVQSDVAYGETMSSSYTYHLMGEYDGHLFLIAFTSLGGNGKVFKINITTGQLAGSLSLSANKAVAIVKDPVNSFEGKLISPSGFFIIFNSNWNFKKYSCADLSLIAEATLTGFNANATRWDLWVDDDYFYLLGTEITNYFDKRIFKFDSVTLARVGASSALSSNTHNPYEFAVDDNHIYWVRGYYGSSTDQYTYVGKLNKATLSFDTTVSDYIHNSAFSGRMLGVADKYVYALGTKGIQIYDKVELAEVGFYDSGGSGGINILDGVPHLIIVPTNARKNVVRFTAII